MGLRIIRALRARCSSLGSQLGQGTVEYVALILLISAVLATVVTAGKSFNGATIQKKITDQLSQQIDHVGEGRAKP
jgi:hypothetical protein